MPTIALTWFDRAVAMFGRRGPQREAEPVDPVMDPSLPMLTVDEGARLRAMTLQAFSGLGRQAQAQPDAVVTDDGLVLELLPLALACRHDERGPGAWSGLVSERIVEIVHPDGAPSALAGLSVEEVRRAVHPRVVHVHDLPPDAVVMRTLAPDLVCVLSVHLPGAVGTLRVDDVERCGPLEELTALALEHLSAMTPGWSVVEREGGRVDVVSSERPYAAALVLLLPGLATTWVRDVPAVDPRLGVLFAVPFGHQLDLHVLHDARARASLTQLALFAATGFNDGEGQVSPDVHWWRGGDSVRVSYLTPHGVALDLPPELEQILDELSPPPRPDALP